MVLITQIQPVALPRAQAVMAAVASGAAERVATPPVRPQTVTPVRRRTRREDEDRFTIADKNHDGEERFHVDAIDDEAATSDSWSLFPVVGPSLAFLAQRIAQELLGPGVYFEPWAQVIAAYRKHLDFQPGPSPSGRSLNFDW